MTSNFKHVNPLKNPEQVEAHKAARLRELLTKVPQPIEPTPFVTLAKDYPELNLEVIEGLLRHGEVANIIAPPKTGKSFLVGGLAWSIASGKPWLGRQVAKGSVLIIDNELHPATLACRLDLIATKLSISSSDRDLLDLVNLRGKLVTINELSDFVAIVRGKYKLVVLDALYRMLPRGISENDNAAMTAIYNELDNFATKCGSAVVVVHHASKGPQGEKSVTDVGAGAGAIARAADTHITIREHESDGHHVLEARTRSFPSPAPISIRYEYPVWTATALEPSVKRQTRQNSEAQQHSDRRAKSEFMNLMPIAGQIQQSELFAGLGWGKDRAKRIASMLIKEGMIYRSTTTNGAHDRVYYSRTELRTESRTA